VSTPTRAPGVSTYYLLLRNEDMCVCVCTVPGNLGTTRSRYEVCYWMEFWEGILSRKSQQETATRLCMYFTFQKRFVQRLGSTKDADFGGRIGIS
jgi:hypothetical protein